MTSTPIAPSAEEFLTRTEPDEPDTEEAPGWEFAIHEESVSTDPLTSIAASLGLMASIIVRRDRQEAVEDETQQALNQLDEEYRQLKALHDAKQQLIEDTLKICSKSTSKLANQIRALLEVPVQVDVPGSQVEPTGEQSGQPDHPPHDADVEVWREYGRNRGLDLTDNLNRSQIRSALGIAQPGGES